MAQNRHFGEQADQSTAHMSSRSCPTPPQHPQHLQHQQQGRYDGWSLASAPTNVDGSVGLANPTPPAESWVEVESQPSSSSLSSIGDEIVTTGLRVGSSYHRRRRLRASARPIPRSETAPPAAETSSQEEYDESDSEEDHNLASSAENFQPSSPSEEPGEDSDDVVVNHDDENGDGDDDDDDEEEEEEDEGDNATALGRASNQPVFQPQPNAFSHPPAQLGQRSYSTNAAMAPHPHNGFTRRSFPGRSQTRVQRGPSFMSPSVREDNDAALRASLTTLLSCAAAARGLPKTKEEASVQQAPPGHNNGVGPSNQPVELLFVPESKLMAEDGDHQQQQQEEEEQEGMATTPPPQEQTYSPTRSKSKGDDASDKGKRPVPVHRGSRMVRKKKRTAAAVSEETLISPTLLTWVVSAGVVVLVSVVGFGAGYVIGREVGRREGLAASLSSINDTASSGREVMRSSGGSLRRFKWGAVGRSIVAAA